MELGVDRGECFGRTQLIADHECEEVFLSNMLLEWVESESTRTDKRIQLPPRETHAFPEWIGDPVPGVGYKWATGRAVYADLHRKQRPNAGGSRSLPSVKPASRPTGCEWSVARAIKS